MGGQGYDEKTALHDKDLGIQDRSVMIPIITNHYSKEVSYYRECVYRLHIIVG